MSDELRACSPTTLGVARAAAHHAVQLLTRAARANVEAVADDSHSNLGWDRDQHRFLSHPLRHANGCCHIALTLSPLRLCLIDGTPSAPLHDLEGHSFDKALEWIDGELAGRGLRRASVVDLPYELPPEVEAVKTFPSASIATEMAALSAWFDLASDVLVAFSYAHSNLNPRPSAVRCWPHHFDIATYVQLEEGSSETVRGIGLGMSPGDGSYDQPYFYVNAWPRLESNSLPQLPAPGHWHTEEFVGAVAPAEEVLALSDIRVQLPSFLERAFEIGRDALRI